MIETSDALAILDEYRKRQEHVINKYEPSQQADHNQLSYHQSQHRYRLLFGGNQSGKSHAAAHDCACNARGVNPYRKIDFPERDTHIWVISSEYVTIKAGIYRHLKAIIPKWDLLYEGPKVPGHNLPTYMEVRRADGFKTTITFMSAKGEAREKFQAAAVDYFYIDEEIPGDIWEELEARTLATGGSFSISATLVESYDWILQLEQMAERGDASVFVTRLNTEKNPYLDTKAVEYLKSKWSSDTLEYRFYGRARRHTGLIYNTWVDSQHIVEPFTIPLDWPRWCAIDPGIRVCAALWVALSPEGHAYAYRELYAQNEPLWEVAREIKVLEHWELNERLTVEFSHYVWEPKDNAEYMVSRIIDPKGRARSEAGEESILSQLYSRFGISCQPADNSIRPGIEDCRYWLEKHKDGIPKFQIFKSLINFQDERKVYRARPLTKKRDQNAPIEDPIKRHDHLMDCWRYIARDDPKFSDRNTTEPFLDRPPKLSIVERLSRKRNRGQQFQWVGFDD